MMVLLLTVIVVGAQETTNDAALNGVFLQAADSGSFTTADDGATILHLVGVSDEIPWQAITPDLEGGVIVTAQFALFWGMMEELNTSALLTTDNIAIELTLTNITINFETYEVLYTVTVNEVYYATAVANAAETPTTPDTFGAATLVINFDQSFIEGLNQGADRAGLRPNLNRNCSFPSNDNCGQPIDIETLIASGTGVFVQSAESGSFVDGSESGYTLTLVGINDQTPWQLINPEFDGGTMDTTIVAQAWAAVEGLNAAALLETDNVTVEMLITAPIYDAETGTLNFEAQAMEWYYTQVQDDPKESASIPDVFDAATLFVVLDDSLIAALDSATVTDDSGMKSCSVLSNGKCNHLGADAYYIR